MPGFPFAVGGPSKNTYSGRPSAASIVRANSRSDCQRWRSSRSTSSAGRFVGSFRYRSFGSAIVTDGAVGANFFSLAGTEERRPEAHHRRSFLDGDLIVTGHSH